MDALVRALVPYVSRVCGAIALDRGDDAMQETFICVLRNLRTLRDPGALHGWVRRIAVRESIRAVRHREVAVDPGTLPDAALGADDVDLATVLDVRAALSGLSPWQRAILVLRDLDGMTEADAAVVLQVPEGTVKSRLHRARTAFARRWAS